MSRARSRHLPSPNERHRQRKLEMGKCLWRLIVRQVPRRIYKGNNMECMAVQHAAGLIIHLLLQPQYALYLHGQF